MDRTNSVQGKIIPIRRIENNYANQKQPSTKKLKKQMVYYENSPTYCDTIQEINSYGTAGRVCNKTVDAVNSCSSLCCGRGFFTVRIHRIEKCNCRFHWCCYVECQKCEFDEWVTVCKWLYQSPWWRYCLGNQSSLVWVTERWMNRQISTGAKNSRSPLAKRTQSQLTLRFSSIDVEMKILSYYHHSLSTHMYTTALPIPRTIN